MKVCHRVIAGFTLILSLGCTASKPASRTPPPAASTATRNAFATQRERQAYVDDNYSRLMRSGRFKDEAEARAYAAYEWQRLHAWPGAGWPIDNEARRRKVQPC